MADDYEVTDQRITTTYGRNGKLLPVVEVSFTTKPEGINGKVDVPQAGYSAQAAKALIEPMVKELKATHNL